MMRRAVPIVFGSVPKDRHPVCESGNAHSSWISAPGSPLDLRGPVDRPFDRMGPEFAGVAALEHLTAVARKFPDKIAISDGACEFSYAALLSKVLGLAHMIATAVPDGQAVGLLLGNSVWHPIATLACMAAGRPSVPLNPRDPAQRHVEIVTSARIPVLIGQGAGDSSGWPERQGVQWIDITRIDGSSGPVSSLAPVCVDAPAMVLYTSGSTGQPKGVVNSQRSLLARVQQQVDACHIGADDIFLPLSGPTTIAGCRETLSALLSGATLYIVDVEAIGLRGVLRQMRSQRITITYCVPALLRALIAAGEKDDFASLRVIRIGGEKVLWTDIALIRNTTKPTCLIQVGYSSTETTGSQWFPPLGWQEQGPHVPAGYLLPGISYAVVDDDGAPAPAGQAGELVIKSNYVLLGYWENGQLVPWPSAADDERCRIFPTGDLAVVDSRGLMHVVGRKGRQLKINGRRVEPAELEVVVRRIPCVSDAVVTVSEASELVVFATAGAGATADFTADIKEVVRRSLPAGLHPSRVHQIAEIPRLSGGKIDFAKLQALDLENRESRALPQVQKTSEMPQARAALEQVWTRILGNVEVSGRWVEAGGDSLKLLRCVMELEDLLGRELRMEAFTVDMSAADMIQVIATGSVSDRPARDEESAAALVLLPGSMGYGPSLAAFAAELGKVAHIIPVRYPDLGSVLAGQGSIEVMADSALDQINAAYPRGEIRLLGYSLGGGVAFEVATRLIAAGRSVQFLGVLDSSIESSGNSHEERLSRTLQRIRSHRTSLYRLLCRAVAKCVARLHWEERFCRLLDAPVLRKFATTRFMLRLELEETLRMRAFGRWVAHPKRPLPITGTIFRCSRRGAPSLGWDRLFAKVNVIPIAGGHLDLVIEPHLSVNGPLIKQAIASSYSGREPPVRQAVNRADTAALKALAG
jgi:acyl-CoA synthetase (AMP-forming)/AMP-acid ligase II/thioesterase domain-containing protein